MHHRRVFNFGRRIRIALLGVMTVMACFLLSGCTKEWEYNPITDINNLEGRRVGVNLSWEADYYLSDRKDMVLYRYDTTSDQIMALDYDKIDALAMDEIMWKTVESLSTGLEKVEPSFGETGSILYLGSDDKELRDEFNEFLAEYKKTEEYRDYLERVSAYEGIYEGPDIPLTGTGPVLRVAVMSEGYPRSFWEPGEDQPQGFDMEALMRFANAKNYQLEFALSTYEDGFTGLINGLYDIQIGYLSDIYAFEVENYGLYVSDSMDKNPMYFVQKKQRDISVDLDAIEE